MEKAVIAIFVCATILAPICSGSVLLDKNEKFSNSKFNLGLKANGNSLLKCEKGKITGVWEFINFFQSLSAECKGAPRIDADSKTTSGYYTCLMETIGMTENDGTPSLKMIETVSVRVFSQTILNNLPSLKGDLHRCALDYESDYNQIDKAREGGAEIFFKCFIDALRKCKDEIGEDYDKICTPALDEDPIILS